MADLLCILSVALFVVGVYLFLQSSHALVMLMGIELLVQAAILNFIATSQRLDGEITFFIVVLLAVAVAEASLLLVLFMRATRQLQTPYIPFYGAL